VEKNQEYNPTYNTLKKCIQINLVKEVKHIYSENKEDETEDSTE
jgi:hypothetical protein